MCLPLVEDDQELVQIDPDEAWDETSECSANENHEHAMSELDLALRRGMLQLQHIDSDAVVAISGAMQVLMATGRVQDLLGPQWSYLPYVFEREDYQRLLVLLAEVNCSDGEFTGSISSKTCRAEPTQKVIRITATCVEPTEQDPYDACLRFLLAIEEMPEDTQLSPWVQPVHPPGMQSCTEEEVPQRGKPSQDSPVPDWSSTLDGTQQWEVLHL